MIKNKTTILLAICLFQFIGFGYYVFFFQNHGYLPSPFLYDKSDTFMDLFHTMFWANNDGRYTEWHSAYPPISFLLLGLIKWLFLGNEQFQDGYGLRDAAINIQIFWVCLYLIIPVIILRAGIWKDFTGKQKLLAYLSIVLSTPMLFALERGNLIIITLIFIAFAINNTGIIRAIAIAILINIKPYFVVLLLQYAIKRQWLDGFKCILASGGMFVITGLLLDSNYLLSITNLFSYAESNSLHSLREVFSMPSSVSVFSYVLNSLTFQNKFNNFTLINFSALAMIIEIIKYVVIFASLAILFLCHKKIDENKVMVILLVVISNLGILVGGYSLTFYVVIIPLLMKMPFTWINFPVVAMMYIPLDFLSVMSDTLNPQNVYLSASLVSINWTVGVGSLIKPILNMVLLTSLSLGVAMMLHKKIRKI